jgi:hypothetical protein
MIAIKIPKTQYSTVSYARLMSVDMPFADAHRGTPFNQKNGPAIALVAAAGTIGAGLTAGGILGGLMVVGGVMSGLGALTGNQTLSTLGMVASIAGGIGIGLQGAAGTAGEGGFWNPFSENSIAFSNTKFGQAFKGVTDAFSSTNSAAGKITDVAKGVDASAIQGSIESASDGAIIRDIGNEVTSGGTLAQKANDFNVSGIFSDAAGGGSKSGLLSNASSMFGEKGIMGAIGGAADAYQQQPLVNARVDQLEQSVDNDKFAMEQQRQRMANMNSQPKVNIGVNPNAQIFNEQPAQQGKYAVAINGEVKYLSQAEYDAVKQQQSQAGLLQQGAAA